MSIDKIIGFEVRNPEIEQRLKDIGHSIGDKLPKGWGMTLLLFEYGTGGSMFYISTAQREDMIRLMREFIAKHEPN